MSAQLDARPAGDQEVTGSIPTRSSSILSLEIDHEIFSVVKKGSCQFLVKECAQVLVKPLED